MLKSGQLVMPHNNQNNNQSNPQSAPPASKPEPLKEKHEEEKLTDLVNKHSIVLVKIKSVFPFDFFPDKLSIDENKVNIVKGEFFGSSYLIGIPIEQIKTVEVTTNPFFSNIKITFNAIDLKEQVVVIKRFKKNEGIRASNIIRGLILARLNDIDFSQINPTEAAEKLEKLGQANTS